MKAWIVQTGHDVYVYGHDAPRRAAHFYLAETIVSLAAEPPPGDRFVDVHALGYVVTEVEADEALAIVAAARARAAMVL